MNTWTFSLVIDGLDVTNLDALDALYEAGCDDASFGEVDGVVTATFDREAATPEAAVLSAIHSIESGPVNIRVVRVQPESELLTATEIAERMNRSRESVRLLIGGDRGPGDFPVPAAREDSRNPLWDSRDVDEWFRVYDLDSVPAHDYWDLISLVARR